MIGIGERKLPYTYAFNPEEIRYLRCLRNMSLSAFGEACGIDEMILSRLETGSIKYSPLYDLKVKRGCEVLAISAAEIQTARTLIALKYEIEKGSSQ
ncbi:hypothetical protein [Scopulibacillus cellulosilyticus]|uniref:HTH cro/C1-type domain-containing protein n=1 Tax=Scopulibacillus cellulosilyticus TaxID=2665665 RepID=A0ABW2PX70_9BACL